MIDIIELMDKPKTSLQHSDRSWMDDRAAYFKRQLEEFSYGDGKGILRMWVERSDKTSKPTFELPISYKLYTLDETVEILVNRERELAA